MLISDTHKFIFIHNPKCGGTTVRNSLKRFDCRNDHYWLFSEVNGIKVDKAHMPLSVFRCYNPDDYKLLDEYFVFGFVRNPYHKVVSGFNEAYPEVYQKMIDGNIKFAAYKTMFEEFCESITREKVKGWHLKFRHLVLQKHMFYIGDKCKADLIIKVEAMQAGGEKLANLSPQLATVVEKWNRQVKNQKPVTFTLAELYSEQSLQKVQKVYHDDFVLFDYDFALPGA